MAWASSFSAYIPVGGKNHLEGLCVPGTDFGAAVTGLTGPARRILDNLFEMSGLEFSEEESAIERKTGLGNRTDRGAGVALDAFGDAFAAILYDFFDNFIFI